jgi:beta-lactamase regulating signal transducer with metallopeptidase domain
MEENYNQQVNTSRTDLPNAVLIMVLGIVSIPLCCACNGALSLVSSIVTLVLANTAKSKYLASPEAYTESSYGNVKTGKICAIVGLVLSILMLILAIALVAMFGTEMMTNPMLMQEKIKDLMGQ